MRRCRGTGWLESEPGTRSKPEVRSKLIDSLLRGGRVLVAEDITDDIAREEQRFYTEVISRVTTPYVLETLPSPRVHRVMSVEGWVEVIRTVSPANKPEVTVPV